MATYGVFYTLLPNGFTPQGRARLSLVASPRPIPGRLGNTPVMHWPEIVAGLGRRFLVLSPGGAEPVEAIVESPAPDPALWASLFSTQTSVGEYDVLSQTLDDAAESQSYAEELNFIQELYAEAKETSPDAKLGPNHPVMQRIAGLNSLRAGAGSRGAATASLAAINDLLDPKRITRARVREAAALLGNPVVSLVPRLRRLRLTAATGDNPPQGTPPAGPLGAVAPAEEADFAQVIGAVMRHAELALLLGLRVDLTMPAFTGSRLIRLGRLDGTVLNGQIPIRQPWSAVVSDPQARRFVMATQQDERAEIVNGMLDLRPVTGEEARYVVSDLDVIGIGQQIDILATRFAADGEPEPAGLPVRRTAGLTVAQSDRRAKRFKHMLERNARFEGQLPDEVEGAPVLYADDVTTGYRVDVSHNGGQFNSLMRRVATYTIGAGSAQTVHVAHDEAQIEPVVLTQQTDTDNNAHLFVGEELFDWNGWGFGGPMPGAVVGAEAVGSPQVATVDPAPLPGYAFLVKTEVEPYTLTKLRFGDRYRFRVRAADLAANSIEANTCDPDLVTPEQKYHRYDVADPPVIVPRKPYRLGENPNRMVVYSDGDGNPLAPPSERHLAPPKMSQRMAELHGMFDPAFGMAVGQGVRDTQFNRAKREENSFLDPMVPGPNGGMVPAEGIAVISTDPANPTPTQLPVPRGEPLALGEYVIHDTATPITPYLPDVVSAGPTLFLLPQTLGATTVPWNPSGGAWPDRPPARLVLRPAQHIKTVTEVQNGRSVITVDLTPGMELPIEISSAITPEGLEVMDAPRPGTVEYNQALKGRMPLLSPRQPMTLLHAVRKPVQDPHILDLDIDVEHPAGTTDIDVTATVKVHSPTTGKVALEATWTEIIDRGYGEVKFETNRVTVASGIVEYGDGIEELAGNFDFGDSKRRVVKFVPAAVTRFQEYFDVPEQDKRLLLREGYAFTRNIIGRIRPKTPKIHSIVPIIERKVTKGYSGSEKYVEVNHLRKGVRVYLKRPWHDSGEGQMLGVVVARNISTAPTIAANATLRDKVTRWGTDLYETTTGPTEFLTPDHFPGRIVVPTDQPVMMTIPGLGSQSSLFDVAAHEVKYDAEKELWYAEVLLSSAIQQHDMPFIRFSLVAFQPTSVVPGANPGDLRSSGLAIADPVQLTATRTVRVSGVDTVPSVRVKISDYRKNDDAHFSARWQTRVFDPTMVPNSAPDICADSVFVNSAYLPHTGLAVSAVLLPVASANAATRDALVKGRIVVEEIRTGWSLQVPTGSEYRSVFTEVIEVKDLF